MAKRFDARKLHLSTRVYYDSVDPRTAAGRDGGRQSLADLDYSPLRRITFPSYVMGLMVSMGGFLLV
jgi:SP family sugar:H+ symporter-like MFS transporter